jgi:hypothetical protein
MKSTRKSSSATAALAGLVAAVAATAGIAPSPFRPASLVTNNLVMQGGRPFVALSDLARALGGTGRYDPARLKSEIQPGPNGVLVLNPGAMAAHGGGGDPHRLGGGQAGSHPSFGLRIGGQDVMFDDGESILLRPGEFAISLNFLARLLGGQARFDPGRGAWVLPPGDPGTPLSFR